MATLLLTAVGTLIGGPIGGALGAIAGRSIDGSLIGGGKREGPRLKEIAVTTSSYGQPIPRHHGRMRAAGSIIWATDLVEHSDSKGGKKGRPAVTSYSYTTSFAVALSSRPIVGVRRIWADGNLLRGEAGDLKAAGLMRVHTGHGDQAPDPLIAADKGAAECPAFRDCAYVVFEDLALETFGNRIPALTFEVIADDGAIALADLVDPLGADASASATLGALAGFANEGGPLAATLETIDILFPLAIDAGGARLTIDSATAAASATAPLLPAPARAWEENDFGAGGGRRQSRDAGEPERVEALRYYDLARDYQPGVQRPTGQARPGRTRTIEFPGAFAADDARALAEAAARRAGWKRETLQWRIAELDPALAPGSHVRVPGVPGLWRIEGWEWRDRGIEFELVRRSPAASAAFAGDPGTVQPPPDLAPGATVLRAFELPAGGTTPDEPTLFAAATGTGAWQGAALYLDRAGELVPAGRTGRARSTIGTLVAPLAASPGLLFDPAAAIEIDLAGEGGGFAPASLAAITLGANRLLVGTEVLQFALAEQTGPSRWRLTGLLRGRGGTEPAALAGHPAATGVVLVDETIMALDPLLIPSHPATTIAAIGLGDAEPVFVPLHGAGLGRMPPCPVHPVITGAPEGALTLAWTRRARAGWDWLDGVDSPLVEERELYRVGLGPVEAPVAEWEVSEPQLILAGGVVSGLAAAHPAAPLWVRQIGRFAQSDPLLLTYLA